MPATFDIFLSYNRRDQREVTTLAQALRDQGLRVFLDRWYANPGKPWPQELERVLETCAAVATCIGPGEMGAWQQRETNFALERQAKDGIVKLFNGQMSRDGYAGHARSPHRHAWFYAEIAVEPSTPVISDHDANRPVINVR